MKDWRATLTPASATLGEAIGRLDKGAMQIILVVEEGNRLIGVVTDGDVRRGLLKGVGLQDSVAPLVNKSPATAAPTSSRAQRLALMRQLSIKHLPIVTPERIVVGLDTLEDVLRSTTRDNPVVLMAGGAGHRLRPLTEQTPKPMLHVGGRPLIETMVRNLVAQGFWRIFLSVNYKAELIETHFRDGSEFGAKVEYLREDKGLGTAGALGLLPEGVKEPVLVMNGDILTTVDFGSIVDFHREHAVAATLAVRDYQYQVPYGVVTIDDLYLKGIVEKPMQSWFVSAGIYVLEPSALTNMTRGEAIDMPTLLDRLRESGNRIAVFPIREYWLDIGRIEDFERALAEFPRIFQ
jgi:dTDP-glucose pyrophosphorylase